MKKVKIALIQSEVVFGDAERNLSAAETLLNSVTQPYDFALLPECFDFGWADPDAATLARPIPNPITQRLSNIAKTKSIHLIAGINELDTNGKPRNTAVLINPNGDIIGRHSKINILTDVEYVYTVGTSLEVFPTPFGNVGIPICADMFVPAIGDALGRMGCDLILSPCAWAVTQSFIDNKKKYGASWLVPYSKVANIYKIPVIGCSNVGKVTRGEWKDWLCIGNSIIVTAEGEVTMLPFGEDAACARVVEVNLYPRPKLGTALG
jgi:predicted amidohydrolase